MNKIISIIIAGALVAIAILCVAQKKAPTFGFAGSDNAFGEGVIHSRIELTTTATTTIAKNYNRQWLRITNDGDSVAWVIASSSVQAATSALYKTGIPLYPVASSSRPNEIEFDSNKLYLGAIQAVSAGGTTSLTITEK